MASQAAAVKRPPAPQPSLPESPRRRAALRGEARRDTSTPASGCGRPRGSRRRRSGRRSGAPARSRRAVERVRAATRPWRASRSTTAGRAFEELPPFKTTVTIDSTRKIITRNDSPDISFDRSINPYRGCEHGCIYCFARPTHAYLGLSPGLDFESKLFVKPEAPQAARARAVGARLRAAHHRHRHQHRSLSADRARSIR